ncbi:hypothetical protein [Helicobacter cetorum]|uniref:Uncharacterized protein n=1 Tax=Helicobacter cetorum (strain ATCC BAA-540 / CCUG 52418 / MIT 99-5656) TaxID=1163745 RepID=I0ERD6_HELCM|nr:hypothetical protein [Helicobacter cetorum]AFI05505.1 hypothetical protein HCD_02425 [Helicobacter cetorum MIT 99-5656]
MKSAEYYATHDKERELMTKKCEQIDMKLFTSHKEPTQEQQAHCEQVALGEYLIQKTLGKANGKTSFRTEKKYY